MMKMLTYSGMASARLKANKRGYLSLAIGVFLSIFLISTFVLGVFGIVNAQLYNRQEKVGTVDMVVLDNELLNDEKLMELGSFERLGHAYVTGSVEGSSLHLGYYDAIGAELLCLSPTAGRLPENPGEIALEPSALEVLELEKVIGDTLELSIIPVDGVAKKRTFTIVGFLPEKSQHLDVVDKPGVNQFPAIITCETEPAFATGRVGIHRVMGLQAGVSLGTALGRFWERYMRPELVTSMYGLTITGKQTSTYSAGEMFWADRELMDMISMAAALAGALLLSCGIGISGAMEGVLSKRREEIGVLRAVGATRRQIRRMFGRENLILALLVSPVAILAGCAAVWILSLMMPKLVRFGLRLWLILPIILFSVITILLSGYLPLVRASKLMPMSVIRDTRMLRRSKKVKSKTIFSAHRLMAARQVRLNPTRQLGTSFLIGLMLVCCALLCSLIASFRFYAMQDFPTFRIADNETSMGVYVQTYAREPISSQSIRQIRSLDHVESIELERELPVYVELEHAPSYARLHTMQEQYGMLDDAAFAEAMAALGENSWWYVDYRDKDRAEYLEFKETYGFAGEAYQTAIITIDPTRANLDALAEYLSEGSIDAAALDSGSTVLVYAPDIWVKQHEHGSYSFFTSLEELESDPYEGHVSISAKNDCFHGGQTLNMTQLYRTGEEAAVIRNDKAVQVGGILKELPEKLHWLWSITAIITTERGLEAMGLRMEELHTVSVYTDELTLQQEEALERQLSAILRRTGGYTLDNQAAEQRKSVQDNQRMLVMFLCIILVFFSVAVGMIVSSVTRQLHNEGRTIGMLRAVGADEKAILGCYSGQLNAAIFGGLGIAGAVYILFGIFSVIDAIGNPFFRIRLADILQWAAVLGLTLAVAAACWALSRFILGLRIREILKKSIIDNIREL
ncbi:MAG: ABC transporter permease [Ruminococcaceae bacterium]|nr:ABC transporter permease [Oscillospiraceae bacterium]